MRNTMLFSIFLLSISHFCAAASGIEKAQADPPELFKCVSEKGMRSFCKKECMTYRDVMFAAEPEPCECDYRQTMEDFCKSNYFGEVMRVYEPIKNPVYTNAMYVGLGILNTTTNFPYRFLHLDLTKLPERCRGSRTSSPFWVGGTLFENFTLTVGRCLYKLNEEVLNRTRSFLPSRNLTCQIHFGEDWVGNMMLN